MLGREILLYRELRDAIQALRADVGITILDACASGAITRLKGGRDHPAFLAGDAGRGAGLRVPHLQLRDGGGAGIGAPGWLVLHPRPRDARCAAPPT